MLSRYFKRELAAQWLRPILFLGLMCAALWGFIGIASEMLEGETKGVDQAILLLFRETGRPAEPIGPKSLEKAARDLTALGGFTVVGLLTASVTGLLVLLRQKITALFSFLSVVSGVGLVQFLKIGFDRPRPELVSHFVDTSTKSFPSGHSTMGFITYLSLGLLACRILPSKGAKTYVMSLAIFTATLVGLSRVYLGVHWPSDVFAGGLLGVFWALLWYAIELKFTKMTGDGGGPSL